MRESYRNALDAGIERRYRQLEYDIMEDVVRRIKKAGKITSTADWQLNRMLILGKSSSDLQKIVASAVEYDDEEVQRLYDQVIENEYTVYKPQYEKINNEFVPYKDNLQLQQLVEAQIRNSNDELKNVTRSMGFMLEDASGRKVWSPLSEVYSGYLDQAVTDIASGAFDYNTVIRKVCRQLTDSGLRTDHQFASNPGDYSGVDYSSGWHNRIDVAARRAIMTGISQLSGQIMDMNAERLGVDRFEVSWHVGARPSHALWQGKVYTKKQLETVCGLGSGDGLLGWNCRHEYYLFFPDSKRQFSDAWLRQQAQLEAQTKSFRGREYNTYEATQKQRRMETNMRAQREKVKLMQAGGADPDDIVIERCKYQAQLDEYREFSKKFGMKTQTERVYYDRKGRVAPSAKQYAAYLKEKEMRATAMRSSSEAHEKRDLHLTAQPGTREYQKQRTAAIIKLGVDEPRPIFASDTFGTIAAGITPKAGTYDVAMHGAPKSVEVFGHRTTARNIAAIIRQRDDYHGEPVRLLSCSTGFGDNCFAQQLANELRVDVTAPDDILWARSDHKFTIGPTRYKNTGKMITYHPEDKK